MQTMQRKAFYSSTDKVVDATEKSLHRLVFLETKGINEELVYEIYHPETNLK